VGGSHGGLACACALIAAGVDPAVRARPGRLSALSVSHSKSGLCGAFVRARRALNRQKRRFRPGQAVAVFERTPEGRGGGAGVVAVGLYPIVIFQYSSTTLYQVSYHIQYLFF
jgi:hypothetical protein